MDRSSPKNDESVNALWRIPVWFPDLDPVLLAQLKLYHSELIKFNAKLNLISRNTERDADEVHFADCILAARSMADVALDKPVYDIGSGNGLPGLVMALMRPQTQFFLLDSDSRKCEFLKHMIQVLKLSNCQVMNMRVESLGVGEVQFAVSRGFASISKSLLAVNRIFPRGSKFFHLKGNSWSTEIVEIPTQVISLWAPELVGEYSLPDSQARRAVVRTTKTG